MGLLQSSQVKANLFIGCQTDCAEVLHIARKLVLLQSPGDLSAVENVSPTKIAKARGLTEIQWTGPPSDLMSLSWGATIAGIAGIMAVLAQLVLAPRRSVKVPPL